MDLISDLNKVGLRNFIGPVKHEINCPFIGITECSIIHYVDQTRPIRHKYITRTLEQYFAINEEIGLIVIFDIAFTWNDRNKYFKILKDKLTEKQKSRIVIIKTISTLNQLLKDLKSLTSPASPHLQESLADLPISLIIIDNISVFYWNTKAQGHLVEEYAALASSLKKTQNMLGCSIISTSWDKKFNVLSSGSENELSSEYTDIPTAYFQAIDHDYYLIQSNKRKQIVIKYKGKEEEQMKEFIDIL